MFSLGQLGDRIRVEHRHSDGTFGLMEPAAPHHDPAQHDPERDWQFGRIYRCNVCDEEIRISPPGGTELSEGE